MVAAVAILIAAAVILLATSESASGNIAAIGALAAAIGVTWQGVGTAVWRAAGRLEKPLWVAALNVAIFEAITELPAPSTHAGLNPKRAHEAVEASDGEARED